MVGRQEPQNLDEDGINVRVSLRNCEMCLIDVEAKRGLEPPQSPLFLSDAYANIA